MSKKERKTEKKQERGSNWLCTFNDLMTLLMVFFVLIFSMSTIDTKKSQGLIGSMQSGLGALEAGRRVDVSVMDSQPSVRKLENDMGNITEVYSDILEDLEEVEDAFPENQEDQKVRNYLPNRYVESLEATPGINTTFTGNGIHIALEDHVLFNSGKADINDRGLPILDKIIEGVKTSPYNIRIEGHSDNTPIHTIRYPSNWELSMDRAIQVLKYFLKSGDILPSRLSAVGYGDIKPLVKNDSAENKRKNRRVEIVLVNKEKR